MGAYDHPPEYPPEDEGEGFDPFEEEEVERRHEQRNAEYDHDRDLERDTVDRVNEGRGDG